MPRSCFSAARPPRCKIPAPLGLSVTQIDRSLDRPAFTLADTLLPDDDTPEDAVRPVGYATLAKIVTTRTEAPEAWRVHKTEKTTSRRILDGVFRPRKR